MIILIKRYGDNAKEWASLRTFHFQEKGDAEGQTLWRRITRAIGEMAEEQSDKPVD
jgi:hypothetical protein|tara:strand:+ start:128 stop:295 length:168 start_codon:yes stop_codon:yes gene_type:complete